MLNSLSNTIIMLNKIVYITIIIFSIVIRIPKMLQITSLSLLISHPSNWKTLSQLMSSNLIPNWPSKKSRLSHSNSSYRSRKRKFYWQNKTNSLVKNWECSIDINTHEELPKILVTSMITHTNRPIGHLLKLTDKHKEITLIDSQILFIMIIISNT